MVPEALSDVVDTFQQRCKEIGKPGEKWHWHREELQHFVELALPKVLMTHSVTLFVDALDECGKDNAVKLVQEFKSILRNIPPLDSKQFRLCFSCRQYPILEVNGILVICLENENGRDISTFVQNKLSDVFRGPACTILDLITNRAQGVFLWARLVVNQVLDLDELYSKLVQQMGRTSLKLIQWICLAERPLSLDEMRWAVVIDAHDPVRSLQEYKDMDDYISDDVRLKRWIQTLSCGLAEISSPSQKNIVQFIHQTVKDFFLQKGLSALEGSSRSLDKTIGMAHYQLARTSIRYFSIAEIGPEGDRATDRT